jgi:hypothetical protein
LNQSLFLLLVFSLFFKQKLALMVCLPHFACLLARLPIRYVREHLVVSTPEGHILHFTVEGSVVRYGARIPTDPVVGVVTCLAWKGDWIVTGDSAGSLHLWDLKAKVSVSGNLHNAAPRDFLALQVVHRSSFLTVNTRMQIRTVVCLALPHVVR